MDVISCGSESDLLILLDVLSFDYMHVQHECITEGQVIRFDHHGASITAELWATAIRLGLWGG